MKNLKFLGNLNRARSAKVPLLFIVIVAIIGFTMFACGGDGDNGGDDGSGGGRTDGGVTLPQSSGTNEVIGKTLYLSDNRKIVFVATGTAYKEYYDDDKLYSEGAYSYNSDNKTITLAIEYVYWDGTKMNKTQAVNAYLKEFDDMIAYIRADFDSFLREMLARDFRDSSDFRDDWYDYNGPMDEDEFFESWLEEKGIDLDEAVSEWKTETGISNGNGYIDMQLKENGYANLNAYRAARRAEMEREMESEFAPTTYDYQFTTDGSLLVQEKLPANKGSNELQGKTFTSTWNNNESYAFTSNTYTVTSNWNTPSETVRTGTYAYDSSAKEVWLRPEKIYDKTMLEYYAESYYSDAAEKAADTNSSFRAEREDYSLNPNKIGYGYNYDDYSISLNRSMLKGVTISPHYPKR